MPGGLPGPRTNFENVPAPETGLIVRFDPDTGHWRDPLGRSWNAAVPFDLPDLDVFRIDAATLETTAEYAHVGTVLFGMAVNPASGVVYVSNTEARNEVRFEGPGCVGCHVLSRRVGAFGTQGEAALQGSPQLFKIPHLRNLYQKVGMFGAAPTDSRSGTRSCAPPPAT
jgi:hypothetical protein